MKVRSSDVKQQGTCSALNRRQFLKRAAAVGGAMAVPCIIPASALGRGGAVAPSERIIMGGIGIGRRGSHDLRWVVVETARRYGRVYQTGTQRLSEANFTVANELLRLGRLGQVHTVRAHISGGNAVMNREWLPGEPLPARDDVDWDGWLGPCPWRPYNSSYLQGGWHGQYDFHTSCIGEWGAHTFAQCQVALGLGETSAVSYEYVKNASGDGMVTRFANGVKMVLQQGGWHGSCGARYEGSEGWVACADGYSRPEVSNPAFLADYTKLVQDYVARTGRVQNHMRNFLDCVKSRQLTVANPVMMHRSMSTVHAANIAMWLQRDMTYDPVKEEFANDPAANRLRSRAMREGWQI